MPSKFPWGPILVGALVSLLFQIACGLLGTGIGLSVFEPERGETADLGLKLGALVFFGVTLAVSFFVGGWLASYWAEPQSKRLASLEGVAVWAVASALLLIFVGGPIGSALGSMLAQAGVGLAATGGADATLKGLEKVRIISDLKLLDGKVVTQLDVPQPGNRIVAKAAKNLKAEVKGLKQTAKADPEVREGAGDVRRTSAGASFAALGGLILSALASLLGAWKGRPPTPTEPQDSSVPLRSAA